MPNIFWYYGLVIIGVAMAFFTMYKKRNIVTLISFYLFAVSFTWIGEFFVLLVLNGYTYKPEVHPDHIADSIIGHVIANTGFYGGTAILVAAFSLRYGWIFLISVCYMLIEILFLKLGIYEQHWWRTFMTGIVVFVYFATMKIWYAKLIENKYKFLRLITFFIISMFIVLLPVGLLALSGKQFFNAGWAENIYLDSARFSFIYEISMGLLYVFFAYVLQKWYWKLTPIFIGLLIDIVLVQMNIMLFQDRWNLLYYTFIRIIGLAIFILLERYSFRTPRVEQQIEP